MANLVPGDRYPPRIQPGVPTPQPAQPGAEETLDLREVLGVLRRHRRFIALIALVVTGLAAFLATRQAPQYRASAVIRLKDARQSMTGGLEAQAMEQMVGKTTDPLLSQIQVLRSRSITQQVVDRIGLRLRTLTDDFSLADLQGVSVTSSSTSHDTITLRFTPRDYTLTTSAGNATAAYGTPVSAGGVSLTVADRPNVETASFEVLSQANAVERVLERLATRPLDKTDVVQVEYTALDPRVAQLVANTAVDVFQSANATQSQQESRRRRLFLEEQLSKTDSALTVAQVDLSNFREREEVYSSRERFAAQQAGILQLEVRLEELSAERNVFIALLNALRSEDADKQRSLSALVAAPAPSSNPVIGQLYVQLVQLMTKRDSATAGPWGNAANNPDVQRLNTLIENTENRLVDAAAAHVSALEARIRSLQDLRGRNSVAIQGLPVKEAEEMRLMQQVETARKLADQLREEYQKARIAEAVEVGQVEVVDMAALPLEPIGTGRALKIALGLMLGLMLGAGGAFVREHLNTKLVRTDELETLLRMPCLAVIPRIDAHTNGNGNRPRLRLPIRAGANGNGVERPLEALVTVGEGRSSGAEAYRSLRTNLLFSQATGTLDRLVVTSSMAAEGKTTTACNLAVTFAQQGKRVLLIDGDLRKARVHKVFGLTREPGLVDVIAEFATLDDSIRPTDVPNLSILTSGTLPPNPSELLGGPRMREVLDELKQRFDMVMIDAPPVLVAGDASILAALSGAGTIVVLRAGETDRAAALASVQQLHGVGARVLGAVLNDPDAKVEKYESHYYYAYQYYGEE